MIALGLLLLGSEQLRGEKEKPPSRADAPPVEIRVREEPQSGVYVYRYTVANGSAFPIAQIRIGYDGDRGEAELNLPPLGWTYASGVPAANASSAPGWEFRYLLTEEDSVSSLRWQVADSTADLMGGQVLTGFDVVTRQEDSLYQHCHWEVYLRSDTEVSYSGTLRQYVATGAEGDVMERLGKLQVFPKPTRGGATIRFSMPDRGDVAVDILDPQGRLVISLPTVTLPAGENDIRWNGKVAGGKNAASGIYFVRVKYGKTQRFGRIVISR